jgi:hypothetical protein
MADQPIDFNALWTRWIEPLAGKDVRGLNGLVNRIVKVDSSGVVRLSRNGLPSKIPLKPFRWTVERVLSGVPVQRKQINEAFPHRYSSGVLLVLEQVGIFEVSGRPATIRLRDERGVTGA